MCISIHALVKRATSFEYPNIYQIGISIHALVKRATHFVSSPFLLFRYFNPRPREEGDILSVRVKERSCDISIHALVKRATVNCVCASENIIISIHALVKRATRGFPNFFYLCDNFNPRPREEGDEIVFVTGGFTGNFNPRPREEGDGAV